MIQGGEVCRHGRDAVIRFRHILGGDVIEYPISGRVPRGRYRRIHPFHRAWDKDLIVLFWAAEILIRIFRCLWNDSVKDLEGLYESHDHCWHPAGNHSPESGDRR